MSLLLASLAVLAGMYIAWNLGANDAANCMGTAVGAGARTLKQAVVLVSVFSFLGAVLQGSNVIKTVGKGIVPISQISSGEVAGVDPTYAIIIALVASFAAGTWVLLATYLKLPVSTTHSIIGAVAGAGLLIVPSLIKWNMLGMIFVSWILTPFGAALIAYCLYKLFAAVLPKIIPEEKSNKALVWLLTISGCYMAYTWGANDVANATGVIVGAGIMTPFQAAVLGGTFIAIGIATWGYRIIETVGSRITTLVPLMAFSAEIAAALNVHIYTFLNIPVSTSHSIVGAVIGVGLVHGRRLVSRKIMCDTVFAWAATPFIAGFIALAIIWILLNIGI
jgi:PiT family inorganic phosphate transporter